MNKAAYQRLLVKCASGVNKPGKYLPSNPMTYKPDPTNQDLDLLDKKWDPMNNQEEAQRFAMKYNKYSKDPAENLKLNMAGGPSNPNSMNGVRKYKPGMFFSSADSVDELVNRKWKDAYERHRSTRSQDFMNAYHKEMSRLYADRYNKAVLGPNYKKYSTRYW